ncbi:MAG: prolyl oligopeptidase family serine peptidase [Azoarcus sp.]|jgi:predicted peptidase|nr:prolyl oligopeptidase family serine peptidase [Azoarcus sp.]
MRRIAILLAAVVSMSTPIRAQEPGKTALQAQEQALAEAHARLALSFGSGMVQAGGRKLPFRFMPPEAVDAGRKYPLLIYLHGSGERGTDNKQQMGAHVLNLAQPAWRERYPAFVFVPQCPPDSWWGIPYRKIVEYTMKPHTAPALFEPPAAPERPGPLEMMLGWVAQAGQRYPIDRDRIYIVGFSMGGMGVYRALEMQPDLFAAAIPIAGNGDPAKASLYYRTPIRIFHGEQDRNVYPAAARRMDVALRAAGGHPKLSLFPDMGHDPARAMSDEGTWDWLFAQKKRRSVVFR